MGIPQTLSTDTIADASVAAATEEVIATLTGVNTSNAETRIALSAWAAFTTGTLVTAAQMRIRRDSLTGTLIADSGDVTAGIAATAPTTMAIAADDTIPASGNRIYVLTLETTGAGTANTITGVSLQATFNAS